MMVGAEQQTDIDDACAHVFAAAKAYYSAAARGGQHTHPSLLMVFEEKVPRGRDSGKVHLIDVSEALQSRNSKEKLAVYMEVLASRNALVVLVSEAWVVLQRRARGAALPVMKGSLEYHPERRETLLMSFAFGSGARALAHALIARDGQGRVTLSDPVMIEEKSGPLSAVPPGATVH